MKVIMLDDYSQTNANKFIHLITEDKLLTNDELTKGLKLHNVKIERVETINGEKVYYIKESKSNLLLG